MIDSFFDVDGCLIDESYNFNIPLRSLLLEVQDLNGKVRFHLNSNRSLENILPIWEKIGFNGVIVYENGLGVFNPLTGKTEIEPVKEINKEKLRELSDEGDIFFVDTDELIKNPEAFFTDATNPIYCEQTRRYTASIYPRVISGRVPISDEQYLREVAMRAVRIFGEEYAILTSTKYYNILLTPKNASKSSPMRQIGRGNKIASFGDGVQDKDMFEESDLIGCPANALDEIKDFVRNRKGFIASLPYTGGVREFVREVLKNDSATH